MPTLIRLFLVLLVLGGIGFAGMIALTVMVDPGEKDVTIKIPARELTVPADNDILDVNDLPAPVNVVSKESSEVAPSSSEETDSSDVKTVDIPAAE